MQEEQQGAREHEKRILIPTVHYCYTKSRRQCDDSNSHPISLPSTHGALTSAKPIRDEVNISDRGRRHSDFVVWAHEKSPEQ